MTNQNKDRDDKFTWEPGQLKIDTSQCADCKNNKGGKRCLVYETIPEQYLLNKTACPSKEPE